VNDAHPPLLLSHLADVVMGQSPTAEFVNEDGLGIPLLNGPSEFGPRHPTPEQWTNSAPRMSQPNDLLFCVRGSTTGRMNWADQPYAIGRGLAAIRAHDPESAPAIRALMEVALPGLLKAATGSTFPNVSRDQLRSLPLNLSRDVAILPIARLLRTFDDKIELNRKITANLEETARTLFQSWFVDFDPVHAKAEGRDPSLPADIAALFPDRFGDDGLPEGWCNSSLLDQADWVNGAAYKNMDFVAATDGLPVIKIAELKAGVTAQTKFTNTKLGDRYRITDGELLFSWSGNPETSIDTFIWTGGDAWLNQHIFAVRENGGPSKAVLHTMLKWLKPVFTAIAEDKQTTGLGHVTKDDMKRLTLPVGSAALMQAFARLIDPLFQKHYSTIVQTRTYVDLRDALLPRLISGELGISSSARQVEAA